MPLTVTGSGARLQDLRVTVAESEALVTVTVRRAWSEEYNHSLPTMTVAGFAAVRDTNG